MRARPTHSLRTRLLLLLFGSIVLTVCAQAFIAYRTSLDETNEIFDYQMEQMALSLRPGLPVGNFPNSGFRESSDESFEFIVQVATRDGKIIFQSTPKTELPIDAALGHSLYELGESTYKVFSLASGSQVIQVAQDRASRRAMARQLALRTVSPIFVMVPLLVFLVWWVVTASLAPVDRVRKQVASRHADELVEVSDAGLPDEIVPLVREINLLFRRVQNAFDIQKNFIADAAHELRSPLAALKLQIEGLRRANDPVTSDVAIHRLATGIDRSTRLVEQLLMLARHQATPNDAEFKEQIHLSMLVQSIVGDVWAAANARSIDIGIIRADYGLVLGHRQAVDILVRNIVDNAIKYAPVGGTINIAVASTALACELSVEDSGQGVPQAERSRIFDRFYRVVGSPTGGSGLGLAIVKTIADMHQATLAVDRSPDLGGLKVSIVFPALASSVDSVS